MRPWPAAMLVLAWSCGGGAPESEHVVQPAAPAVPAPAAEPSAPGAAELPKGVDVPVSPAPATAAQPATSATPTAPAPAIAKGEPAPTDEKPQATEAAREATKPAATPTPKAEPPKTEATPAPAVEPVPIPKAEPPPPPKPEPEPEPPKSKVTVPHTDHVRVDIPAGMQALLDADTRMQPWVNKAIAIIDRCYASKGLGASATIVGEVTMHPNARPDVDLKSLPPTLAGVVACATGDLMRNKMPLFTGPEGERHTLKVRFKP